MWDKIIENKFLAAICIIYTIVDLVLAIFNWIKRRLIVKISVKTPTLFLNPNNILSAIFEISNDGEHTLKNVEFAYSIKKLTTSDGLTWNGDENFSSTIIFPNEKSNKKLSNFLPGEKNTIQFPLNLFNVGNQIDYVDLAIKLKMYTFFFKKEQKFRFESIADSSNKLHLTQVPLDKS